MNVKIPKAPPKKALMSEIEAPCRTPGSNRFWAPLDIKQNPLLKCSGCLLPPTNKPTPVPTPPPPPPKFACHFSARMELVYVKYGGFSQKIGKSIYDQWNFPMVFEELNQTSELEVMVRNEESRAELKFKCQYLPSSSNKRKHWNIASTGRGNPSVVASYGSTQSEAEMAPTFWPRKWGAFVYPMEPQQWGRPGYAHFVFAPYCDVACTVFADDEVTHITYRRRAVPVRDPTPRYFDDNPKFLHWARSKHFCFKYHKDAELSIEAVNVQGRGACEGNGGISLNCESAISAWNQFSTNEQARIVAFSRARAEHPYKESKTCVVPKSENKPYSWLWASSGQQWTKLVFKGFVT